jgi:uncharacterized membrane protein
LERRSRKKWRAAVKVKILIGVLVFLIVVNLATIGSYVYFRVQHKPVDVVSNFPGRFPRPPRLELDEAQRGQLVELRMSFENDTREISDEIAKTREEIYQMLRQDSVPMGSVEEKLRKVAELRIQVEQIAIKKLVEARHYLSPQQVDHLYRFLLMESPRRVGPDFKMRPGALRGRDQLKNYNHKK